MVISHRSNNHQSDFFFTYLRSLVLFVSFNNTRYFRGDEINDNEAERLVLCNRVHIVRLDSIPCVANSNSFNRKFAIPTENLAAS